MDTSDSNKRMNFRILLVSDFLDLRILAHEETPSPTLDRLTKARGRVREILLEETLRIGRRAH